MITFYDSSIHVLVGEAFPFIEFRPTLPHSGKIENNDIISDLALSSERDLHSWKAFIWFKWPYPFFRRWKPLVEHQPPRKSSDNDLWNQGKLNAGTDLEEELLLPLFVLRVPPFWLKLTHVSTIHRSCESWRLTIRGMGPRIVIGIVKGTIPKNFKFFQTFTCIVGSSLLMHILKCL